MPRLVAIAAVYIAGFTLLPAQSNSPVAPKPDVASENDEPVLRSSVREVILDVIVRQKNLQLARKLKASDFTITEDGVPQTIKNFRLITGDETTPASPTQTNQSGASVGDATVAGSRKVQEPNFVSVIFENMTPKSRKYARDAVLAFLQQELQSNTYVAIFALDSRLNLLASFSNKRDMLTRAVEQASIGNYSTLSNDGSNVLTQANYTVTGGPAGISINSSLDPARTPDLMAGGAAQSIGEGARVAAAIDADQREISMYQGGMRTVVALMNLVKYEATLPGRKTVIYLSEGLNLPPGQHEMIRSVISSANRANVSFYGVDVRGLDLANANALAKNLLTNAAASSRQQSGFGAISKSAAKQDDTILELNVANNQLNMQELAKGTGGFTIENTNEIGKSMLRIMEDVRTHYEISYTPTSDVYDGHFRQVKVAVSNPKLTIQSRDGYYAMPDLNGRSLLPFELPGLKALNEKTPPKDFDFRTAALRFTPVDGGFRYEIGFTLPIANLKPQLNTELAKIRLHAIFFALIKDSRGQIVDKVSREIDREVPKEKFEQFERGDIIFTTPITLHAGRYTIEAAAVDAASNRAGTKRAAFVVAPPGPMAVSDIALIHELDPLTEPRDLANPLEFAGGKITPELSAATKRPGGASLFFVVYPGRGTEKPRVTVRFFRDGAEVASIEPDVSAPDQLNSIPVIASAKLPPGDYEAQITVHQGENAARKSTAFTVSR